jgi:hypothetical protein
MQRIEKGRGEKETSSLQQEVRDCFVPPLPSNVGLLKHSQFIKEERERKGT